MTINFKERNVIKVCRIDVEDFKLEDLDHTMWEVAPKIEINHYWSGEEAPIERHMSAKLLWSNNALFIKFLCNQREPLVINSEPQLQQKTIGLWERDVCEIFIASNPEEPERYLEFEAAPTGEWLDLAIHQMASSRETDWNFHSGMTTKTLIEEDKITISICIPWSAFGYIPKLGERWLTNLFRCVGGGSNRGYLAWQPTYTPQPNFHVPSRFGWMEFI
jgi:hypothetical protein